MEAIKRADMNREEAVATCDTIRRGLGEIRDLALDLHDRNGWAALGYPTWGACVSSEFAASYRHINRQLQAALIEKEIIDAEAKSDAIGPIGPIAQANTVVKEAIPESQLRPLAAVKPGKRSDVWKEAKATAPEGKVTAKHVRETVDRKLGKPKPETAPEVPKSQYKTEVNGQFVPDPPDVVARRAAGKIADGVVVEITEPEPDDEPEAAPAAELPAGVTEDEWVAALPLSSVLAGTSLKIFQDDARRYFRMKLAREAVRNRNKVAGKGLRKDGAYLRRIGGFLTTKDPRDWIKCPTIDNGGCGGTGQVEMVGACPHCYGRGYTIDNRREWRPSA